VGRLLAALGLLPARQRAVATADAGDTAARERRPVRVADAGPGDPDHGFSDASAPVKARLETLKRHPQRARVQAEINEVSTLLARGRDAAVKGTSRRAPRSTR
jgi:hypothetical protein